MKRIFAGAMALTLMAGTAAVAQPYGHDNDHHDNGRHRGWYKDRGPHHHWRRGEHMGYNDWRNARVVDYRVHHLRPPPRGYEWREVNGQYVLAAVATGLIASIILNSGR